MKKLMLMAAVLVSGVLLAAAFAADKELQLPTDDKFIVKAVECTVAEIKFADTAAARTSNPDVKAFAQKIRDDHANCLKQLMDQAAQRKLAVVQGLDPDQREIAAKLAKLEGKPLDEEYIRGVIERHQKAIAMMEGQNKDGKIAEINTISKDALPKLKQHVEEARKVQEKLKS